MTDVKVGLVVLLVALSFLAAGELAGQRFQAMSDLSLESIRLGASDIEVVTPATPPIPHLGDETEVQVDRVISYSTSPEYPPANDAPTPSGR